ncbi:hypothetical protein [Dyella mobilis]|uniref:Uncharacterized protein n=1 Tax=Dyella mobilis TaxID=1849582 RepID=A0ABS2KKK9_9GAMM|nr:hypothetical protein [Dyella mobilis]MBM7131624.1 hypothetical protein [Dyella mobilis]GLQ96400.1 hypothetical protein GCM10007863_08180 [Dyella mobilis]
MRVHTWMRPWLLAMALMGMVRVGWASDSTLIDPATRIDPVMVLANFDLGPCSQEIPGLLNRPLLGFALDPDKMKQMPTYVFCRNLPQAMLQHLLAHHVDAVLQEFDTQPLKRDPYIAAFQAFEQKAFKAPENAKRYVLQYDGTYFGENARANLVISLFSPVNADGKRAHLGDFDLGNLLYEPVVPYAKYTTLRLMSPDDVAERIAATLESRCAKKGLFGSSMPCTDRFHLTAPGR